MTTPFPDIFIINLKQSVDRRLHMQKVMDPLNIPYEFIEAVDGRKLDPQLVAQIKKDSLEFQTKYKREISSGEIGCALSHIHLYEKIVNEHTQHAIILEDDSFPLYPEEFKLFCQHIIKGSTFELILLCFTNSSTSFADHFKKQVRYKKNILRIGHKEKIYDSKQGYMIGRPTSLSLSAVAYYVSLDGARKLLSQAYPVRMPADHLTASADKWGVRLGVLNKNLCSFLTRMDGNDSTIGDEERIASFSSSFAKQKYELRQWMKKNKCIKFMWDYLWILPQLYLVRIGIIDYKK